MSSVQVDNIMQRSGFYNQVRTGPVLQPQDGDEEQKFEDIFALPAGQRAAAQIEESKDEFGPAASLQAPVTDAKFNDVWSAG